MTGPLTGRSNQLTVHVRVVRHAVRLKYMSFLFVDHTSTKLGGECVQEFVSTAVPNTSLRLSQPGY